MPPQNPLRVHRLEPQPQDQKEGDAAAEGGGEEAVPRPVPRLESLDMCASLFHKSSKVVWFRFMLLGVLV